MIMKALVALVFLAFCGLQLWALVTQRYFWLGAFVVLDVVVALFAKTRTPGRHPQSIKP